MDALQSLFRREGGIAARAERPHFFGLSNSLHVGLGGELVHANPMVRRVVAGSALASRPVSTYVTAARPSSRPGARRSGEGSRAHGSDRLHLALLGLIVLGGFLVRLRWLGEPMRWDEAATFQKYALGSVGHIVGTYDRPNNQILYSLLTHFSLGIFGHAVWVVRLVAFLAGLAIVPVSYLVARRLFDPLSGLWAAALTASFGPLVDYSVNGRGYTLGALFVLLALWLGARLLERDSRREWAALVVCCVLAVYTLPTMAIGVAIVGLWMVLKDRRILLPLGIALAAAAALSLLLYSAALGQTGWDAVTPLARNWGSVTGLAGDVFANWNRAAPHPLDWLIAAGFIASLFIDWRLAGASLAVLLGVVLLGPIAPFVRSWLFLLPLYLIQASAGLAWATRRAGAAAPAIAAVILGVALISTGLRSTDVPPVTDNDIVALLKKYTPPGEHVLIDRYAAAPTHYYYYERFGDPGLETTAVRSADRASRHIVVVVPRGTPATETVYKAGGIAGGPARLLARREWIDIYDVPLLPHAEARRLRN
jgi:hypothetical protein